MIIYLNEYRKNILRKLLKEYETNHNRRNRIRLFKGDLEGLFDMNYEDLAHTLHDLRVCRLIDIPYENNTHVEIYLYQNMINEQLNANAHYVRRYKDWMEEPFVFLSKTGDYYSADPEGEELLDENYEEND